MKMNVNPAPINLNLATLRDLPDNVDTPNYSRGKLSAGIVHIGLGNFHRAHQAWYIHQLMKNGTALDWAIVGASVRPQDKQRRDLLLGQDCLTTLIELDPKQKSAEVVGSMIDYVEIEQNNSALITRMTDPAIRIVSLTVTEGGYYIDPVTGEFDATHPDIIYDASFPNTPKTAFGSIIAALRKRRDDNLGPFTILSCDNLQGNGRIVKNTVLSLARLSDEKLSDWIETNCTFPNSMVDCIVPATGLKELEIVKRIGVNDAAPVTHENFRQWVIEDNFCAGRPDFDKVGVTFSDRVHDYESMKLRILNGGHQLISIPAELLGIETISGAMCHSGIHRFLHRTIASEIVPTVSDVPGMTAGAYLELIDARFSNSAIEDTTRRVAFDGSSRQPGFIVPSIKLALKTGQSVNGLSLISALWMRYCLGWREDGSQIEANDPLHETLKEVALSARTNPAIWIQQKQFYGDLADNPVFKFTFLKWVESLDQIGVEATLVSFASDGAPT